MAVDDTDVFVNLKQKIKKTKIALSGWSRNTFGDIFKQLKIREEIMRMKEELFEVDPSALNKIVLKIISRKNKEIYSL